MNNLSNEIVHLSKVLEKQIPKGYHELVIEYVRQNIVVTAYSILLLIIGAVTLALTTRALFKSFSNKKNSALYYLGDNGYGSQTYQMSGLGVVAVIALIVSFITIAIVLISLPTSIQHVVAPNYYLIKSFIK